MTALSSRVLVLNLSWMPVDVTSLEEAINMVCCAEPRGRFIDPETYAVYTFEEWVEDWNDAVLAAKTAEYEMIGTPKFSFRVPEIVKLNYYNGMGDGHVTRDKPKFSRRNIFLRDRYACQYCSSKHRSENLSLDHVVPKAQGGGMTWKNIVVSCVKCNEKKRNRTPEQAGMTLIKQPCMPKPDELRRGFGERLKRKIGKRVPETWQAFLSQYYWSVELQE